MSRFRSTLATGIGGLLFVGGIGVLASGVPTRRGTGWELVFGSSIPGWAFLVSFVGGPVFILAGAVIGMRYGHLERYHTDYDPETGTIDSNHPFATFHEYVARPDTTDAGAHPEKFVMNRWHLVAVCVLPTVLLPAYLLGTGVFSGTVLAVIVVVLLLSGVLSFVVADRALRDRDDYEASFG